MATQYTAGLTTGQVLTAATMNSIGAAWETWTPNFRPETGAWTSSTTTAAKYGRIQNLVFGQAGITINTFGTGGGNVTFDLPITSARGNPFGIGSGREANITGNTFQAISFTTTVGRLIFFNNAVTAGANYNYSFFFIYEAA
jgi:hypothetical protein